MGRYNDGREHDIAQLKREYQQTSSPEKRRQIEQIAKTINSESSAVRSMRETLIKETRKGNVENVKDINDYIKNKPQYQNNEKI